jgi:hypothetical protein
VKIKKICKYGQHANIMNVGTQTGTCETKIWETQTGSVDIYLIEFKNTCRMEQELETDHSSIYLIGKLRAKM